MSAAFATASPVRIKASHRRRRKVAAGRFVQRYYDPQIGRFLSNDPVSTNPSTGASFNRYSYASDNPYRFTDPDGRQSCESRDCKYPKAPDVQSKRSRAEAHAAKLAQFGVTQVGASYAGMSSSNSPGPFRAGYKFASGGFPSKPAVKPSGPKHVETGTVQLGVSIGGAEVGGASVTAGVAFDGNGGAAWYTETTGTVGPQADVHATLNIQISNAQNVSQLQGASGVLQAKAGAIGYLGFQTATGSSDGDVVTSAGLSVGGGAGGGTAGGASHTEIYEWNR